MAPLSQQGLGFTAILLIRAGLAVALLLSAAANLKKQKHRRP